MHLFYLEQTRALYFIVRHFIVSKKVWNTCERHRKEHWHKNEPFAAGYSAERWTVQMRHLHTFAWRRPCRYFSSTDWSGINSQLRVCSHVLWPVVSILQGSTLSHQQKFDRSLGALLHKQHYAANHWWNRWAHMQEIVGVDMKRQKITAPHAALVIRQHIIVFFYSCLEKVTAKM